MKRLSIKKIINDNFIQTSQRIAMLILFLTLAFSAKATYTLSDADVEMDANGYIISCSYSFADKDIIIPETLDGYAVKGIGTDYNNLFYDKDIESIQFPSGIEFIGRYAFRSNKLTSVDIPTGITTLEERVFSANLLTSITIPDNIISIGQEAFSYNPLTSVTIPSGVDYIGKSAFRSNKLTSITISAGVISIGESAFFNNELTSVTIPNSVSSIGIDAFGSNELTGLTSFVLPTLPVTGFVDWLDSDGNHYAGGATVTNLSILYRANFPYTLTDDDVEMDFLGNIISCSYSFEASMITIPEFLDGFPVLGIGDDYKHLFFEKAITSVQLPSTLRNIGPSAFSNNLLTAVTIPDNVATIQKNAFSFNLLTTITIPNSVTAVGTSAFASNQITSLTLSTNCDSIAGMVFANNQLSGITIPDNVISIGTDAFGNNELTTVTIPNSVRYIGEGAFNFNQLTSFVLPTPTIPEFIDWIDINGDHYDAGATVTNLTTFYRASIPYTLKDDEVEMDSNGYIISCSYSFEIKDIVIPDTLDGIAVKGIGDDYANLFINKGMTSLQLPSGLEAIPFNAFRSNSLKSLDIPEGVTSIGYAAFEYNLLASVNIPNTVTFIDAYAFNRNYLTSVDIPGSVRILGGDAFANNNLESITIPNSISNLQTGVFRGNMLTSVNIPNGIVTIGAQAFASNRLTSIDLPNSVTYIKSNAFLDNEFTTYQLPTPTVAGFTNWVDGTGNDHEGGASISTELDTYYRARAPYTLTDDDVEMDKYGTILSCSYNFEASEITIPETLGGYTVLGIKHGIYLSGVFADKGILSIKFPQGIKSIGAVSFSANLLTSIDIPNSVFGISNRAFAGNYLTSVDIPGSVINLGIDAFAYNKLESITLSNGISNLQTGVFQRNMLTSVTIPNSVIKIGEHAFGYNPLTSFVLPTPTLPGFAYWENSKTGIEYQGGDTVTDLTGYYQARFGYVLTDADVEVDANGYIISSSYIGTVKDIIIPDSLDGYKIVGIADGTVNSGVFYNLALTSVKIPEGVEYIGSYAFNSNQLGDVSIPSTVVSIGEYAFSINPLSGFALPTPPLTGFAGWLEVNSGNRYAGGETVTDFSGFYQAISAYTLKDEDVELDANGYIISCNYSFDSKDIIIPDSLDGIKVIGIADGIVDSGVNSGGSLKGVADVAANSGLFYNKSITSVNLPAGLEYIGAYAFNSNQLTNITIPSGVVFIGAEAFSLNQFTEFVLPTPTLTGFIDWLDSNGNHYAGGATVSDLSTNYRASFPYTLTDADVEMDAMGYIISCSYGFEASVITIPNTLDGAAVKGIGDDYNNLFYEKAISSIQLPSGLEYIGEYAFSKNLLTSVTIPSSVAFIGADAFSNNLLTGFVLPEAQKAGYNFDNWNGSIAANTEVTELSVAYTANFTLITTSIENVAGFNVRVYPNPATALITIEADDMHCVELMSISGVLNKQLKITGTSCTIDLSSYESGIYLLRIAGKHGTCVKRIVKE